MEAPVIKSKQQHSNKKKVPLKSVLCTPYNIQWPKIEKGIEEEIFHYLRNVLTKYNLKNPTVSKHLKKEERKTAIETLLGEKTLEEKNLKSQLVYGVNEVTKCLEKDRLCLILVDKSAYTLTKHLLQLASVRQCTAVAISGLTKNLAPLLALTQLSCLGFRKPKDTDNDSFKGLFEYTQEKVPKIELPWLNFEESLTAFLEVDSDDDDNKDNIAQSEEITDKKNYSDSLSVKCSSVKTTLLFEKKLTDTDSNNIKAEGFGNSDFIAFRDDSSGICESSEVKNVVKKQNTHPKIISNLGAGNSKKRKSNLKHNSKKGKQIKKDFPDSNSSSNYKKMSLYKMQPNINRQKKKTKKKKKT